MLTGPDVQVEQPINRVSIPTRGNKFIFSQSVEIDCGAQPAPCLYHTGNGPADRTSECLLTPTGTEIKKKKIQKPTSVTPQDFMAYTSTPLPLSTRLLHPVT
jgi:hypothetical protein